MILLSYFLWTLTIFVIEYLLSWRVQFDFVKITVHRAIETKQLSFPMCTNFSTILIFQCSGNNQFSKLGYFSRSKGKENTSFAMYVSSGERRIGEKMKNISRITVTTNISSKLRRKKRNKKNWFQTPSPNIRYFSYSIQIWTQRTSYTEPTIAWVTVIGTVLSAFVIFLLIHL